MIVAVCVAVGLHNNLAEVLKLFKHHLPIVGVYLFVEGAIHQVAGHIV